jgi:hypothetical protein
MRVVTRMADRLLDAVVPQITAKAGCAPETVTEYCYCKAGYIYNKECTVISNCTLRCGSCYNTGAVGPC